MRWVLLILGVVALGVGVVWTLQGFNVLSGSGMSGQDHLYLARPHRRRDRAGADWLWSDTEQHANCLTAQPPQDTDGSERPPIECAMRDAAEHYGVEMTEQSWHELGKRPHNKNPSH